MIHEVHVAQTVLARANSQFGEGRSAEGAPSEFDFVSGPLAAAVFAFRGFDGLPFDVVAAVRSYTIVDPFFGPVVFVGVLVSDRTVEIVDFSADPDYWTVADEQPEKRCTRVRFPASPPASDRVRCGQRLVSEPSSTGR